MTTSTIFIPSLRQNVTTSEINDVIEHQYNIGIIDRIEILDRGDDNNRYKMAYVHLTFNTENSVTQKIIDRFKDRGIYHLHVTKYSDYTDRYEIIWSLVECNSYQKNIPITLPNTPKIENFI